MHLWRFPAPTPPPLPHVMYLHVMYAKKVRPGHFILAKVNSDTLTVSAQASENNRWVDLNISKPIPLNILDRFEQMEADFDMEAENSDNTEGAKSQSSH